MADDSNPAVTILPAATVLTMNPMQPRAEAVAVCGDRIHAVGSVDSIQAGLRLAGREHQIDDTFSDEVILPGLIEAHSHISTTGIFWQMPNFLGAVRVPGPDGTLHGGFTTIDQVIDALRAYASRVPEGPVVGWGFDPVQLDQPVDIDRTVLDRVSTTRPVVVGNNSGHVAYINSFAIESKGWHTGNLPPGVATDAVGEPTGELDELVGESQVFSLLKIDPATAGDAVTRAVQTVAAMGRRAGCTTISDLLSGLVPGDIDAMLALSADPAFPVRISIYVAHQAVQQMGLDAFKKLQDRSTDRCRVAGVKLIADGSIQNFTADLNYPYYYCGKPNGIADFTAEDFATAFRQYHDAGIQVATHVNGDGAIDLALGGIERALVANPRPDHRHRIEHVQMATSDQMTRMATLGVGANVFAKHVHYWGDFHRSTSLGPDRAAQMDSALAMQRHGVRFSLHSDAWVTPIDQLESVWCAATRKTRSGYVLGPEQRLPVSDGLRSVTLDAAYLLGEEANRGSIEPGKYADLTVVDREPTDADPDGVHDVAIVATMLGGVVHPVE